MRLRTRFVLLIALAALGPLALLGGVAIKVSTVRVVAKVTEVQVRTAQALAEHVGSWVDLQTRLLARQVSTFDVATLQDDERAALLRLVYRQNPAVQIVSLTDSAGQPLAPSVYLDAPATGELADRAVIDDARLRRFALEVEEVRRRTPPGRVGLGEPARREGQAGAVLVLAARLAEGATLGVELDLAPLEARFAVSEGSTERVALLGAGGGPALGDSALVDPAAFASLPVGALVDEMRYLAPDGTEVLAASAPVAGTGWRVVVSEPLASTTAAARAITARTAWVMGVAAGVAVVLGLLVSRQVTQPVLALRDAALAVAEGEYGRRVESQPGGGELTELTHAFNFMSRKLQLDRELIATKNAEIEAFNRELQDRVDERTRQLKDAQEQLIRGARLAAVGEMGAGLAHELNNPVAGILGLAQVLAARGGGDAAMLRSIEEQARRCSEIVARMQRFSRLEADRGPVDRHGWDVVDLVAVIEEVLGLVQASYRDRGVELARELGPDLRVRGDRAALRQAIDQVLQSLRAAAGPGARLFVHGHADEDHVLVDFSLGGAPLRIGQDDWMAAGMSFWAARQALAAHGGLLEEPTLPPHGVPTEARWRLRLPRA